MQLYGEIKRQTYFLLLLPSLEKQNLLQRKQTDFHISPMGSGETAHCSIFPYIWRVEKVRSYLKLR